MADRVSEDVYESTDPDRNQLLLFKVILDHYKYVTTVHKEYWWIERK